MVDALLNKVGGALGKTYLFAGLLPAAVALAGWHWYFKGDQDLSRIASALESAKGSEDILLLIVLWMMLAFILFAIRVPLFSLFEKMPSIRLFRPLIKIQLAKRHCIHRRRRDLEWRYTVACWYKQNFTKSAARFRPNWVTVPDISEAVSASKAARERVSQISSRGAIHVNGILGRQIQEGTIKLYLCSLSKEFCIDDELREWRNTIASRGVTLILDSLAEDVYREWIAVKARADSYPDGVWIHPTSLGNRLLALDDYAEKRYGMDTSTLWNRLWWIIPKDAKQEVTDLKLATETLMNLSFLLIGLGVSVFVIDAIKSYAILSLGDMSRAWRIAGFLMTCLLLAYIFYRGAVISVEGLSRKMVTLIDLHRLRLLAFLGFRPKTVEEEEDLMQELHYFFVQAKKRSSSRDLTLELNFPAGESGKGTKGKEGADA